MKLYEESMFDSVPSLVLGPHPTKGERRATNWVVHCASPCLLMSDSSSGLSKLLCAAVLYTQRVQIVSTAEQRRGRGRGKGQENRSSSNIVRFPTSL